MMENYLKQFSCSNEESNILHVYNIDLHPNNKSVINLYNQTGLPQLSDSK